MKASSNVKAIPSPCIIKIARETPRGMLASHWPAAGLASLDLTRRGSTDVAVQQLLRLCRTLAEEN